MSIQGCTRRRFLKVIGFGAASLAVPGCMKGNRRAANESASDAPNFVVIFTAKSPHEAFFYYRG